MKDNPEISVIFPVHNEQDNLIPLHAEIKEVLGSRLTYELIFVDDGSKDNSYAVLAKIAAAATANTNAVIGSKLTAKAVKATPNAPKRRCRAAERVKTGFVIKTSFF